MQSHEQRLFTDIGIACAQETATTTNLLPRQRHVGRIMAAFDFRIDGFARLQPHNPFMIEQLRFRKPRGNGTIARARLRMPSTRVVLHKSIFFKQDSSLRFHSKTATRRRPILQYCSPLPDFSAFCPPVDISVDQHFFAQALANLPHGREFRFLDALTQLTPGISGAAHYLVRGDEAFLAAHFPGHPMMPGVILVEAIAQLGGVVCQSAPDQAKLADVRLTAIRNAKIFGAAAPGDTLLIQATIEGRMAGLVQVSGEVQAQAAGGGDCRLLASAKVTLSGDVTPPIE